MTDVGVSGEFLLVIYKNPCGNEIFLNFLTALDRPWITILRWTHDWLGLVFGAEVNVFTSGKRSSGQDCNMYDTPAIFWINGVVWQAGITSRRKSCLCWQCLRSTRFFWKVFQNIIYQHRFIRLSFIFIYVDTYYLPVRGIS